MKLNIRLYQDIKLLKVSTKSKHTQNNNNNTYLNKYEHRACLADPVSLFTLANTQINNRVGKHLKALQW